MILEAIGFGLAVAFIILGIIGIAIPILPGILLIWMTVLVYASLTDFTSIGYIAFALITIIALISGTADFWLPLLGAKKTGASFRSLILGVVGAIIGTIIGATTVVATLLGTIIGYAAGIIFGEYLKHRDWRLALKASLGGLAGWGVATIFQITAGVVILAIFIINVLTA